MPLGMDPHYPYGQAQTEASLSKALTDQQALVWRAHELWKRDAAGTVLAWREAFAQLQHLRHVDPDHGGLVCRFRPAASAARRSRGKA